MRIRILSGVGQLLIINTTRWESFLDPAICLLLFEHFRLPFPSQGFGLPWIVCKILYGGIWTASSQVAFRKLRLRELRIIAFSGCSP